VAGAFALDRAGSQLKASRMKRLPSTIVASLLASVAFASVAPAFASVIDATPQCGGEKDDKSGTGKPAPAPTPAPKPPS